MSLLIHFPLESGCEDYAFLDQAVADLEQGLDSILTDSLETLELDTSLDETDAITSSVSSGFLHLVSTLSYFSSHPAAFGFWASTPPDNITLNAANRKADQSISDFQTCVDAAAHATLDMEQLISHLQVALVDTLSSLPEAEGDVIPVSEVCELLLRIHDILDKAVSMQVGNSAHILAYLFNSISRQHCEVWASQFPFHHSLREVIPPSEACQYGCINWSLAQAHSVGLSQSFPLKEGWQGQTMDWVPIHSTEETYVRVCARD